MKISALITTLVLGASSVASADHQVEPSITYRDRDRDFDDREPMVRDHRMPVDLIGPPVQRGWTMLSSSERLRWGRDAVQLYAPVRASQLMLAANQGSTFIQRVEITFANGRTQTIELGQRLHHRQPLTIDVPGRSRMVSRIVVFGRGSFGSSYRVLAA